MQSGKKIIKGFWLKNEFLNANEFCPIIPLKEKGSIFYPEKSKHVLDKNDILIGEYWFDGNCWCFSVISKYKYLSV